jgi:alkylhydroperoxidase family enzyme
MPRVEPLSPPYDPETAANLAAMTPPGLDPIGLFRTFAVNLPMADAMLPLGRYELSRKLSITLRQREILIDRTCARCGCEYEWGVHVAFLAERAALTADQVTSLTSGSPSDPCWADAAERLLIRAADELHESSDIDDELWDALAGHFDQAQLLDIVLLCGWYHAISFVATAARVAIEPGAPRFVR